MVSVLALVVGHAGRVRRDLGPGGVGLRLERPVLPREARPRVGVQGGHVRYEEVGGDGCPALLVGRGGGGGGRLGAQDEPAVDGVLLHRHGRGLRLDVPVGDDGRGGRRRAHALVEVVVGLVEVLPAGGKKSRLNLDLIFLIVFLLMHNNAKDTFEIPPSLHFFSFSFPPFSVRKEVESEEGKGSGRKEMK